MTAEPSSATELESLLQFLYACPVGLVAFGPTGWVEHLNPLAANLLTLASGTVELSNVLTALGGAWPTLPDELTSAQFGVVVEGHRIPVSGAGSISWVAATLVRVADDQWMMVLTDASKQVSGERALSNGERRLRTVFDSIDEGFCVCEILTDASGAPIDYRFLEINPLFSEMTGLIEPAGRTALELVPDLEQFWVDTYGRVALQGETIRFEQGSEAMGRWFDVFAMPIEPAGHFAVVFKDQTERRRAEAATQQAAAEATFRAQLTDTLRSVDDPTSIKREAARVLGEHLGADRVHYAEIEASGAYGTVRTEYRTNGLSSVVGRHHLDDFGTALMDEFRAGRIVRVDDASLDDRLGARHRANVAALGIRAFMMVPVTRDGRVRSAIMVHSREPRTWTASEATIVDESAERTLAAVDRARSNEALRLQHQRSDAVTALITALEQASSHDAQAQLVVDAMIGLLGDYATLEAPGDDHPILAVAHRDNEMTSVLRQLRDHALHPGAAFSMGRAAGGENQLLSPITRAMLSEFAPSAEAAELLGRLGPRSHMAVPVSLGGRRAGALMVGITSPVRDLFTHADLLFLRDTADRIGVVLTATALRRQEHHIAVRLQQALLPDEILWHPHCVVEARYAAATADLEVGGDWYDTYRWDDGRLGVMVGDVVGHNLESAATMGRLRSASAALAPQSDGSPAAMLDALDGFARGRHGADFATAVCVTIDPATGELSYSSAGHPPVLVVSPDGRCNRLDDALSPPLCAGRGDQPRPERSVILEPGSLVVMYSDGLVERRRQPADVGIQQLQDAIAEVAHRPIDAIADHLIEQLQVRPFEDDVVVVCFRYTPVSDRFHRLITAEGHQFPALRRSLRSWLTERGVDAGRAGDALLAVSEAVTNAAEHAYRDGDAGDVEIDITDHEHHLTIHVTDHGRWRSRPAEAPVGGRGLNIMRAVTQRYERVSTPVGTTLTMIVATPERQPAAADTGRR